MRPAAWPLCGLALAAHTILACGPDPSHPDPATASTSSPTSASDSSLPSPLDLMEALRTRLRTDRTQACIAAARIEGERNEVAIVCADETSPRPITPDTAFEIGSVTETMTGVLLANAIRESRLDLDDPLSNHLPESTLTPSESQAPIRLRHLVTHTSGLPDLPPETAEDPENPYATLSTAQVFASLQAAQLSFDPGTQSSYSNLGYMLLSAILIQTFEDPFASLLADRLFGPLGMKSAFVGQAPNGVPLAQGHLSTGRETHAWDYSDEAAGIGGVRASLDDMIRYARAALGEGPPSIVGLLEATQTELATSHGLPKRGMGWHLEPVGNSGIAWHEAFTGGTSSWILVDRRAQRGLVLLIDTSWSNLGGVEALAHHLFEPSARSLPPPRQVELPPGDLLEQLSGTYKLDKLDGGVRVELRERSGALFALTEVQREFELGYDSYGDFYPLDFDALLTPTPQVDGTLTFVWTEGGVSFQAERIE